MANILNIEDLKTYFNTYRGLVKAVDGVSIHIGEKEIVGLVGESGCGKSVSMLSAMQLIPIPPGEIAGGSVIFEGKNLLESNDYDVAILDIMGVKGFELLKIANERDVPALMLTAHALSEESLKKSAENGASYYAPKDEINKIDVFVADVLEAREKKKSAWIKVFERLGSFYDKKFGGPNWREKEKEFWEKRVKALK